jgi:pyruvate/2-oxoacid:ferredoxin oxidoreductase alpha subunit
VNSYTHDERGISTEDPALTARLQEKLQRKGAALAAEVASMSAVLSTGPADARTVLFTWGSCTDPCIEVAEVLGLRVVQPVVLWPFPADAIRAALKGADHVVAVEQNATAQLARLAGAEGIAVPGRILKYDGRPFSLEELEARVREEHLVPRLRELFDPARPQGGTAGAGLGRAAPGTGGPCHRHRLPCQDGRLPGRELLLRHPRAGDAGGHRDRPCQP